MSDYNNPKYKPKQAPKREIETDKAKRLREQEEANMREIRTFRGGYNVND